jgi:hypothetical protein
MTRRRHDPAQRRKHNEHLQRRHPPPSAQARTQKREYRDQGEEISLDDAQRTRILTVIDLKIKRPAQQAETHESEQEQKTPFATQYAIVFVHREVV